MGGFKKYFGQPVNFRRKKSTLFNWLKECWVDVGMERDALLSNVGKEALIESRLESYPIYASCFRLPQKICDRLSSMMTKFWCLLTLRAKQFIGQIRKPFRMKKNLVV